MIGRVMLTVVWSAVTPQKKGRYKYIATFEFLNSAIAFTTGYGPFGQSAKRSISDILEPYLSMFQGRLL